MCTQTFENRQYLFKFKEADPPQVDQPQEHIEYLRIYPPPGGLKPEPDAEVGKKVPFRSLRLSAKVSTG